MYFSVFTNGQRDALHCVLAIVVEIHFLLVCAQAEHAAVLQKKGVPHGLQPCGRLGWEQTSGMAA